MSDAKLVQELIEIAKNIKNEFPATAEKIEQAADAIEDYRTSLSKIVLWINGHMGWYAHISPNDEYYRACIEPGNIASKAMKK